MAHTISSKNPVGLPPANGVVDSAARLWMQQAMQIIVQLQEVVARLEDRVRLLEEL